MHWCDYFAKHLYFLCLRLLSVRFIFSCLHFLKTFSMWMIIMLTDLLNIRWKKEHLIKNCLLCFFSYCHISTPLIPQTFSLQRPSPTLTPHARRRAHTHTLPNRKFSILCGSAGSQPAICIFLISYFCIYLCLFQCLAYKSSPII